MTPNELTSTPSVPVTRRKIVKAGAGFAYATPAIAAALKMSTSRAAAQVSGECTTGENCAAGVIANCGLDGICACVANVDGGLACVERACSFVSCTTGSDCDSGLCISAPGCCEVPDPFCGTPCTDGGQDLAAAQTGWH